MYHRENYIKEISKILSWIVVHVEQMNSISLFDINQISEDFYAELLNLVYGYELKNANVVEKNISSIDLIDDVNRVSFQVTSDNTSTKIKHTLKLFIEDERYLKYDSVKIILLKSKKKYKTKFKTEGKFIFDKDLDVIDTNDLIGEIRNKTVDEQKSIYEFLNKEIMTNISTETESSEVSTIIDLVEYISNHKKITKQINVVVDPEYKINNRFREFADGLTSEYMRLFKLYNDALSIVREEIGLDEVQSLVTVYYLQDISVEYLNQTNDDPMEALELLVQFFEKKLSVNGKKYDKMAIRYYLLDELIKCSVFPNERSEYDVVNQ